MRRPNTVTCLLLGAELTGRSAGALAPRLRSTALVALDESQGSHCETPGHHAPASQRIAWFHPPKTGTSFGTLLIHKANKSLPAEARMSDCTKSPDAPILTPDTYTDPRSTSFYEPHKCLGATDQIYFRYSYDEFFKGVFWGSGGSSVIDDGCVSERGRLVGGFELCCSHCKTNCDFGAHRFVCEADFARFRGSFIGLWREPARLAASNYVRALDNTNYMPEYDTTDDAFRRGLLDYAAAARGGVTRMLAGAVAAASDGSSVFPLACGTAAGFTSAVAPSAQPLLPLASRRLTTGFAFVGMTDEFPLTACLFHLTFGGLCSEYELENSRETQGASTSELAELLAAANYSDPVDEALYHIAKQRFDSEVRRLNATSTRCAAIACPLE